MSCDISIPEGHSHNPRVHDMKEFKTRLADDYKNTFLCFCFPLSCLFFFSFLYKPLAQFSVTTSSVSQKLPWPWIS